MYKIAESAVQFATCNNYILVHVYSQKNWLTF